MALFIIQNNRGEFLGKSLIWDAAADAGSLYCTPHKDAAINQLVELNSRDYALRGEVVICDADNKGRPKLVLNPSTKTSEPSLALQVSASETAARR